MKSHQNQKNQKELGSRPTDVAKNATTQTFNIIDDEVTLTLSTSDLNKNLISVDFCDEFFKEYFEMDLNRETLKGMADFILKYLKKK